MKANILVSILLARVVGCMCVCAGVCCAMVRNVDYNFHYDFVVFLGPVERSHHLSVEQLSRLFIKRNRKECTVRE